MKPRKPVVVAALLFLLALGCSHSYVVHPGSINTFDSQTYDTLIVYHDAIESAKADLTSGQFPVAAKPVLNRFIEAYNTLQGVWTVYHTSGSANPDATAVTAALTQAAVAFTDLIGVNAKYKNPPKSVAPLVPVGSVP